jgi:hypothetical protein
MDFWREFSGRSCGERQIINAGNSHKAIAGIFHPILLSPDKFKAQY